jgi:hypothetical protein
MDPGDRRKVDFYKWIKIGGLLSFLPFVLVAGPLAGFYLGNYLEKKFNQPSYVSIALITVGFIGSFAEAVKVVKAALKAQEKN